MALKYSLSAWGKPSNQPVVIVTGMSAWSGQKRVKSFSFLAHHSS